MLNKPLPMPASEDPTPFLLVGDVKESVLDICLQGFARERWQNEDDERRY